MLMGNRTRLRLGNSSALPLVLAFLSSTSCIPRRGTHPAASQPAVPAPTATSASSSSPGPAQPQAQLTLLIKVEGLGLFRDENLEAARLVADFARKRGLRVVEPEVAHRAFELARVGKDPVRGENCGRPLSESDAESRYQAMLGASGKLVVSVGCDKGACTLHLWTFDELGFYGAQISALSSSYASHLPWRQALTQALASMPMTSTTEDDGKGGLGYLTGDMVQNVVVAHPETLGWGIREARDWEPIGDPSDPSNLQMTDGKEALRRCFGDRDNIAELLVAIDPRGKVTRCESRNADSASDMCACNAFLVRGRASEALRGKRVFVSASFSVADIVTPAHAVVDVRVNTHLVSYRSRHGESLLRPLVSDSSIEAWDPPQDFPIARCFAQNKDGRDRGFRIKVEFDSVGKAPRAQVVESKPPSSESETACLERAFRDAAAPCPAVKASSAEALVWVGFLTIGSKRR
jgi:hypothetical protein